MTVCLFSLTLGIITEMGVVTMQMCDASKGGYQEPDSDGIVRFKAHGPINRETRHGVTELTESDTNNLPVFSDFYCQCANEITVGAESLTLIRTWSQLSIRL